MDVQLLFKESKNKYPLDVTDTKNEQVLENLFDYQLVVIGKMISRPQLKKINS